MECNHRCSSQIIVSVPPNCGVMGCVVTGVLPGKKLTSNVKQSPHRAWKINSYLFLNLGMKKWQESLLCSRFSIKIIPRASKNMTFFGTLLSSEKIPLLVKPIPPFLCRVRHFSMFFVCVSSPSGRPRLWGSFRFVKTFISGLLSSWSGSFEPSSELGAEVFFFFLCLSLNLEVRFGGMEVSFLQTAEHRGPA